MKLKDKKWLSLVRQICNFVYISLQEQNSSLYDFIKFKDVPDSSMYQ